MTRPLFNDARGPATLAGMPPFLFQGVTMRVLPLRARIDRLRAFCDEYLNLMPQEIAHFQPSMPFVYLMLLNYGRMSSRTANVGWVAQNEVAFAIPLDWYRKEGGRLVFKDFASVCPFIFVDDEMSQVTGREVYGWPKVQATLDAGVNPWALHPHARSHLLSLSTGVFPEAYQGRKKEIRVIVEVEEEPASSITRFPPEPRDPASPWFTLPRMMQGSATVFQSFADLWTQLPTRGYPLGTDAWPEKVARALEDYNFVSRAPFFNTINLKQFRDAERPTQACYQALVNSTMQVTRLNEGGLLGEQHVLGGMASGGFRVKLHQYGTFPVVESLGLETAKEHSGKDTRVAVLEPLLPFWLDMDLDYGLGDVVCWRTRNSGWQVASESDEAASSGSTSDQEAEAPRSGAGEGSRENSTSVSETEEPPSVPYNTALGAANQAQLGPFLFRDTMLRVLPLLADEGKLQAFVDSYLNVGEKGLHFDVFGRFVYLVIQSYDQMASETDNIGQWASRSTRFCVPVRVRDGEGRLLTTGLVNPYVYTESQVGATTARETIGWPSEQADHCCPPSTWMESGDPDERLESLLTLRTELLPALNVGQKMEERTLLEVVKGRLLGDDDRLWSEVASTWGPQLLRDLEIKQDAVARDPEGYQTLQALVLEVLGFGKPVNDFSLKQFRDSSDPERACYQAIVRSRQLIERLHDLREIEDELHVLLHRQASVPIVETLGLQVKATHVGDASLVDVLQPLRPFMLRADLRTLRSENACWRSEDETWQDVGLKIPTYFSGDSHVSVGPGLVEAIDRDERAERGAWKERSRKLHLELFCSEWNRGARPSDLLRLAQARRAVESLEPQIAIDGILSREWAHAGQARWKRQVLEGEDVTIKPDHCVRRDSIGDESLSDALFPPVEEADFAGGERDEMGWFASPVATLAASLAEEPPPPPSKERAAKAKARVAKGARRAKKAGGLPRGGPGRKKKR